MFLHSFKISEFFCCFLLLVFFPQLIEFLGLKYSIGILMPLRYCDLLWNYTIVH